MRLALTLFYMTHNDIATVKWYDLDAGMNWGVAEIPSGDVNKFYFGFFALNADNVAVIIYAKQDYSSFRVREGDEGPRNFFRRRNSALEFKRESFPLLDKLAKIAIVH